MIKGQKRDSDPIPGNLRPFPNIRASLVAHRVKRLPAMREARVWSLDQEDPLRRKWQPTLVLLPGKSRGRRSPVGYSPWGCTESDTTERLHFHALEEEMATHSSILAWRIPGTGAWWAVVYGFTQSQTQLTWLSSSSSSINSSGLPWWLSIKEYACQCMRCEFDTWVWKNP